MKVELKKERNEPFTEIKYWIYIDGSAKQCFSDYTDAYDYYKSIDGKKKIVEILESKEV